MVACAPVHQRVDTHMKHPWIRGKALRTLLALRELQRGDELKLFVTMPDAQGHHLHPRFRREVVVVENRAALYGVVGVPYDGWFLVRPTKYAGGCWITKDNVKAWRPKQHS